MQVKNKLKHINQIILLLALSSILYSCKAKKVQAAEKAKNEDVSQYQNYTKARVIKSDLDGCSWLIVTEEGEKRLEPESIEDEYKVDQLKIWLQYKSRKGNSICMSGELVTITAIAKRN